MQNLSQKHCVPCEGGTKPLDHTKTTEYLEEIDQWHLTEDVSLDKTLVFTDFKSALDFVNKIGVIAETEGHHPDIGIFGWNKVKIHLTTHAIGGLSDNDFILAAKIDDVYSSL